MKPMPIFFLLPLLLAACASQGPNYAQIVDGDDDARMTVRKIEVSSDIAVIRPDYQIVIGSASRVVPTERKVTWQLPMQPAPVIPPVAQVEPIKEASAPKKVDQALHLDDAHFEFGSARLTKSATEILDRSVVEIEKLAPRKLSIVGHTDSVGGDSFNQKLSERRAEAVFSYLRAKGLKVQDVDRVGFGERAPIADNATAKGRAQNRRAEIMATVSK